MQEHPSIKGKHLTLIERRKIERWHNRKHRSEGTDCTTTARLLSKGDESGGEPSFL
ncbi:MAG TPA: hypothetical protein VGC17_04770 [Lactovum miscens]|uniref:hypothetical protein n=1 Tax=Lactovum miscens TaxID=190387 RepID=UPI002ED8EC9B